MNALPFLCVAVFSGSIHNHFATARILSINPQNMDREQVQDLLPIYKRLGVGFDKA